jgi:very-short-patch-repair endonuclease
MPERTNPPLPSRSRAFARQLRQAQTDAENLLWRHLRGSRLSGLKFRRQHPIPPYIVDFYCDSARVAVELDGSQHAECVDQERTRFLGALGIRVLRFWDNDVLARPEAVLEAILASIQDPTLTPTPLPMGEGLKQERL